MKKIVWLIGLSIIALGAVSWTWNTKAFEEAPVQELVQTLSNEEKTIQALAASSERILVGRCLETKSEWVEDNRILVTLATIEVSDTLKGDTTSTVTVVLPGGADVNRKFPVAMTYAGAPSIAQGDEVFLFLTPEGLVPGGYAVSGFAEGKFSVLNDDTGNKVVSTDSISGTVKPGPGAVRGQRRMQPLAEFKNKVQEYVAQ